MKITKDNIYDFLKTLKYKLTKNKFIFGKTTNEDIELYNKIKNFVPSIPTSEIVNEIKKFVGKSLVIEVGAKRGLWTFVLQTNNVNIKGINENIENKFSKQINNYTIPPFFTEIEELSDFNAVKKYNPKVLFSVWVNMYASLKIFKGNKVVFIGEPMEAPDYLPRSSGSEEFHQLLFTDWKIIKKMNSNNFYGVHDKVFFYKRKNKLIKSYPKVNELIKLFYKYGPESKYIISKNQQLFQYAIFRDFIFDTVLTKQLLEIISKFINKNNKILIFNDRRGLLSYLLKLKNFTNFIPKEMILEDDYVLDKFFIPKSYTPIFEMSQVVKTYQYDILIVNNHLHPKIDENNFLLMIYQLMKTEYNFIIYLGHNKDYYAGRTLKKLIEEKYYLVKRLLPPYFADFETNFKSEIIIYKL